MKLSFKNVPKMVIQSVFQAMGPYPRPVIQVWSRCRQPAFTNLISQGHLAYKGAPLELLGKASFLYDASFSKLLFEGL